MGNELSCCRTEEENSSGSLDVSRSASVDASSGLRRRQGKSSLNEALRKASLLYSDTSASGSTGSIFDSHLKSSSTSPAAQQQIYHQQQQMHSLKKKFSAPKNQKDVGLSEEFASTGSLPLRRNSAQKDVKILLLGTGESGKSTILKQMRILHNGGFALEDRLSFRLDIYKNIVEGMQQIIRAIRELKIDFRTEESQGKVDLFSQYLQDLPQPEYEEWDGIPFNILEAVNFLWSDSGIQKIYVELMHMRYIIDSAPYFFDEIDRIAVPGYIPTDADIVRARHTTTGITEVSFKSKYFNIKMVDVGGQRSERDRKWIQCFENVTCVIFCVSLTEFDQVLLEENTTNRMLESFRLFEDVVNSQWFLNSSIVLFLNKTDLFCKKLLTVPLSEYFEDFRGDNKSFEQAAEFLRDKFLSLNQYRLQIYPYLTCATDTENISMVFQAVEETVLANALRDTGIF